MWFKFCPALLCVVASPVFAKVTEIWWNITYVEDANPSGLLRRRVIGVNGTWPPPPHDVSTNDTLIVHVLNSLSEPTTLHHHGLFLNYSTWFDGAQGVSQCGIPPGQSFDYIIPINSSGQWGTYWVHGHALGHYVDGLRAPFVIHPSTEVHSYDAEFTVILGDWYHEEYSVLLKRFINVANPGGAEPVPDSALIYFAQNGTYIGPISGTNPSNSHVGFNENAALPFEPSKTYRLRIVNTSALATFFFWIGGHHMRIIEVDGTDVEESAIDILSITVAQRYSVLVTARNDTSSNWEIHADMDPNMFTSDTVPLRPNVTSYITYNLSAPFSFSDFVGTYNDVNDTALVPVVVEPMLPADRTIELEITFNTMDDGTNRAMFNQITYNSPLVPTALSVLTLGPNATDLTAYGTTSFILDHLSAVQIILKNGDSGKHPFHLHGHKVQIVNRANDYTSSNSTLNPPIMEGQVNPIRRDTVGVPPRGSVALRVMADNPGTWLLHCYIEWHLEAGLAVTFIEAPLVMQQRAETVQGPPAALAQHCRALNLPVSGNAAGHATATDLSGLITGPFPQNNGWHTKGVLAMTGCVLTAVLGMLTVAWFVISGGRART